jgi:hypothetical protein
MIQNQQQNDYEVRWENRCMASGPAGRNLRTFWSSRQPRPGKRTVEQQIAKILGA